MTMMTRKRRRMAAEATAESPSSVLPEELMIEILSRVDESNPLQLRCVCKWWKSLIVDPEFVKKHLFRSFMELTDLASKATESIDAFELQLSHAPTAPHDEDETDDETDGETDGEEDEEEGAEEVEEEEQQENVDDDNDGDEEEGEEEEEKNLVMNLVNRLDNLLLIVRSMKVSMEKIKVDVKAIKDRMKCLQSFLRIYLKTANGNASQLS